MSDDDSDASETEAEANRPSFEGEVIQNSKDTDEDSGDD